MSFVITFFSFFLVSIKALKKTFVLLINRVFISSSVPPLRESSYFFFTFFYLVENEGLSVTVTWAIINSLIICFLPTVLMLSLSDLLAQNSKLLSRQIYSPKTLSKLGLSNSSLKKKSLLRKEIL